MRTLPPQHLRHGDWVDVRDQLLTIFYKIIFQPLVQEMNAEKLKLLLGIRNASDSAIISALRTGRIQYADGAFSGRFESSISKALRAIGAVYSRTQKVFKIDPSRVSVEIMQAAATYKEQAKAIHHQLELRLDAAEKDIDKSIEIYKVNAWESTERVEEGFASHAKILTIPLELNPASREKLAQDYTDNMKLWIKKFSQKTITELREDVDLNAQQGYRFDKMVDMIKGRYRVTANKAKFLARQETGLFMAKYRQLRFSEAGVRSYRWSTSHDARVRDAHRHLDGRVFFYNDPPITDTATGARNNPGQDYNCRCVDIPRLETLTRKEVQAL